MKPILLLFGAAMALTQCMKSTEPTPPPDPRVIPVTTKQPEENKIYPIAVIGAGAGGTMAANRAVLNNNEVLLFAGAKQERRRSRGNWVRKVDNIPGYGNYTRTVLELRNEVLSDLIQQPLSHNLFLIEDSITSIEKQDSCFKLTDGTGRNHFAKYIVLATGIMDEQPHIQGSIRPILPYANSQTVLYCALCDGHRSYGKKTIVIGHSEQAANTALLISEKYHHPGMTLLTNGKKLEYSLESLQKKNITVLEEPILEVLGNQELKQLSGFKLENGTVINAEICFVALGIRPNNSLALQLGAKVDERGLVVADSQGETSISGLFVIGDLKSGSLKQIYAAWQDAVESIQLINRRLRE
jgi:thioredoxin reductase (NADPH)